MKHRLFLISILILSLILSTCAAPQVTEEPAEKMQIEPTEVEVEPTEAPEEPTEEPVEEPTSEEVETSIKMERLVLVAPPGPMAIPLAYLVVNDKLSNVAEETELVVWENPDQLKAIISGNQGDFVTAPSNATATFYNKELGVQLLDISVWNILYVISPDPNVQSLVDMQGQSITVPFKGLNYLPIIVINCRNYEWL